MKLSEIQARLEEISIDVEALSDVQGEEPSQEQQDQFLALNNEAKELEVKLDSAKAFEAAKAEVVARRAASAQPALNVQPKIENKEEDKMDKLPAKPAYNSSKVFASAGDAHVASQFLMATAGDRKAQEFMAAQSEGTDNKGGFTVPTPLASELINLVEGYGIARNVCRRIVMGAPTWSVPKLVGHSTIYYPSESATITESDLSFGQISMTAKKMAGLVKMSTEIREDSLISMTDTIVRDLAWGFAKEEDTNLFTGGSLLTGGIEGDADVNTSATVASVGALALTDLTAVVVGAGQERGLNHKWYMNATLWNGQIRDLLNAAGGNMDSNIAGGVAPSLFGYPVELVSAMPGASAASGDLLCVFGDLSVSHYFGDRRSLSFNVLNELFAVNDQVGIICTQRVDIASVNPEVLSVLKLA